LLEIGEWLYKLDFAKVEKPSSDAVKRMFKGFKSGMNSNENGIKRGCANFSKKKLVH
jgi:hypothetical protein